MFGLARWVISQLDHRALPTIRLLNLSKPSSALMLIWTDDEPFLFVSFHWMCVSVVLAIAFSSPMEFCVWNSGVQYGC